MKQALRLAPQLTAARLRLRRGDAWLDVLAVLSFALSTVMALTMTGGIWMFSQWNAHPTAHHAALGDEIGWGNDGRYLELYLSLAFAAGALLVIPIFSLGASAARLGARGRSERLSSLRLIGVTGGQTVAISLVETMVQWALGTVVGTIAYYLSLPLWANVTFLEEKIKPSQMMLPAGILVAVLAALLVIAVLSTIIGLQRVRISPLGVARREASPAMRHWRPLAFLVAVSLYVIWATANPGATRDSVQYIVMAGMILLLVAGISVVGPWILQLFAYPGTTTRSVPRLLGMRRILDDPRAAWRTVNSISLLCFMAGFFAVIPLESGDSGSFLFQDIFTGVTITLGFGFAVAALSTLMNQSSTVFDRAPETNALSQIGFPRRVFAWTRIYQVMGPLLLASVASAALGLGMGALTAAVGVSTSGIWRMVITVVLGLALSGVALAICEPLERRVLESRGRAND